MSDPGNNDSGNGDSKNSECKDSFASILGAVLLGMFIFGIIFTIAGFAIYKFTDSRLPTSMGNIATGNINDKTLETLNTAVTKLNESAETMSMFTMLLAATLEPNNQAFQQLLTTNTGDSKKTTLIKSFETLKNKIFSSIQSQPQMMLSQNPQPPQNLPQPPQNLPPPPFQ